MTTSTFIKRSAVTASIVSLGVSALTTPAYAVVVNFSSWQRFGDVAIPGASQANLSTDGRQNDDFPAPNGTFNFSGTPAGEAAPFPNLQDFLNIPDTALDIGGAAFEGSAIQNIVPVQAGDVFSFNYNSSSNEAVSSPNDFAFFLVDNGVFVLPNSATGFNSYTFSTPGSYNLALGVVDTNDYVVTSTLQVSNANIQPVPMEFSPAGIMALGAWGAITKLNSLGRKRKFSRSASAEK